MKYINVHESKTTSFLGPYAQRPDHLITLANCPQSKIDSLIHWCVINRLHTYTDEVKHWLSANVGLCGDTWEIAGSTSVPSFVRIYFARKEDAMRFKLVYG